LLRVGIGLFLLLIGMYETGIVTSSVAGKGPDFLRVDSSGKWLPPPVPLEIGDVRQPQVQLALGGFALLMILTCWRVRGAILIGIAATAAVGYYVGAGQAPTGVFAWPWNYGLEQVAFQLDIPGALQVSFFPVLLTLFLMSFLDTIGTLYALARQAICWTSKETCPTSRSRCW